MSDPYVGEIRIFGFNFPPQGWAKCEGQLLSISQNSALYAILGTMYGGNGQSTFGLPNLIGRVSCAFGQGPQLSQRVQGQQFGTTTVTLLTSQIPVHNHTYKAMVATSSQLANSPTSGSYLAHTLRQRDFSNSTAPDTNLAPAAIGVAGSSTGHQNMQPYLGMNICICLQGIFPQRQ